jgi:hypothetical protein
MDSQLSSSVIRRITANARFSEPKRSTTACVPANSVGSGSRPSAAMTSMSGSRAWRASSSRSSAIRRRGRISRRRKRLARNCWRRDSSLKMENVPIPAGSTDAEPSGCCRVDDFEESGASLLYLRILALQGFRQGRDRSLVQLHQCFYRFRRVREWK